MMETTTITTTAELDWVSAVQAILREGVEDPGGVDYHGREAELLEDLRRMVRTWRGYETTALLRRGQFTEQPISPDLAARLERSCVCAWLRANGEAALADIIARGGHRTTPPVRHEPASVHSQQPASAIDDPLVVALDGAMMALGRLPASMPPGLFREIESHMETALRLALRRAAGAPPVRSEQPEAQENERLRSCIAELVRHGDALAGDGHHSDDCPSREGARESCDCGVFEHFESWRLARYEVLGRGGRRLVQESHSEKEPKR